MLCALLALKNSPKRHATDGRLACHGRQDGAAVGVLTNLAQNATRVSTLCSSGGSRVRRFLGLEATFERDFSLGYCSSAQGEHRLAHELDRAGAIGRGYEITHVYVPSGFFASPTLDHARAALTEAANGRPRNADFSPMSAKIGLL